MWSEKYLHQANYRSVMVQGRYCADYTRGRVVDHTSMCMLVSTVDEPLLSMSSHFIQADDPSAQPEPHSASDETKRMSQNCVAGLSFRGESRSCPTPYSFECKQSYLPQ